MKHRELGVVVFLAALFLVMVPGNAFATLEQAKLYQATFGGDKPKCQTCHIDKIPKKAEGGHEWNDYGKKLKAAAQAVPDAEVYKKVGKNDQAVY